MAPDPLGFHGGRRMMTPNLTVVGQMYEGLDHLYEVVAVGCSSQYRLRALDAPSLEVWASGLELSRMRRLIPEGLRELEALWSLAPARVAPALSARLSATKAQQGVTGDGA